MGCMGKSNLNLKAVVNKRSSPSTFHFYVQEKEKKKYRKAQVHPKHDSGKIKVQTPTFPWLSPCSRKFKEHDETF